MAMLEQTTTRPQPSALLVVACETLQDAAGVLKESQREMLLLTLVEKLKAVIPPNMVLTQVSGYDFAIFAPGLSKPWEAVSLSKQVLTLLASDCRCTVSSCGPAPVSVSRCLIAN